MLKFLATIFFLLVMLSQTFQLFVIEALYSVYKKEITSKNCVNRNKPVLKCLGKCYMAKQLKDQDNQENEGPDFKKTKFELRNFTAATPIEVADYNLLPKTIHYPTAECIIISNFSSIFRPPRA